MFMKRSVPSNIWPGYICELKYSLTYLVVGKYYFNSKWSLEKSGLGAICFIPVRGEN